MAAKEDDKFKKGAIGVVAGTFDAASPNSKVTFDNVIVKVAESITVATGGGGGSGGGGGGAAPTTAPLPTQPPPTGNGKLIIVMCQDIEVTVTIFGGGQVIRQESLRNAGATDKKKLQATYAKLDVVELKREIDDLLDTLLSQRPK